MPKRYIYVYLSVHCTSVHLRQHSTLISFIFAVASLWPEPFPFRPLFTDHQILSHASGSLDLQHEPTGLGSVSCYLCTNHCIEIVLRIFYFSFPYKSYSFLFLLVKYLVLWLYMYNVHNVHMNILLNRRAFFLCVHNISMSRPFLYVALQTSRHRDP